MEQNEEKNETEFSGVQQLLRGLPKVHAPEDTFDFVAAKLNIGKKKNAYATVVLLFTRPTFITSAAASIILLISTVLLLRHQPGGHQSAELPLQSQELVVYYHKSTQPTPKPVFAALKKEEGLLRKRQLPGTAGQEVEFRDKYGERAISEKPLPLLPVEQQAPPVENSFSAPATGTVERTAILKAKDSLKPR